MSKAVEMGDEDGGCVVVFLAPSAGVFGLRLGTLRTPCAADQLFGSVGHEDVEELPPVGDLEALDESCRTIAEQGCPADTCCRE